MSDTGTPPCIYCGSTRTVDCGYIGETQALHIECETCRHAFLGDGRTDA